MLRHIMSQFVEHLPEQESRLKAALQNQDSNAYAKCLTELLNSLRQLQARELTDACTRQLQEFRAMSSERWEAELTELLGALNTFSIDLQMTGYQERQTGEQAADHTGQGAIKQKIILAVDDTAFFLRSLKANLQGTGYQLICLTSGKEALRFLKKSKPDLCILDIDMPEISGYELARKIKVIHNSIPIIFLTGNAQKEYVMKAMEVGAVDFIIKPINREQVLKRIAKYI